MRLLRPIVIAAAMLAMAAGAFQPMYVRVFAMDANAVRARFTELPYWRLSGLRRLLLQAGARTPPGATVALWAPFNEWDGGYGYAFRRAPFVIPDKHIVPMLESDRDQPTTRYLAGAQYLVCWHACPPVTGFETMWRSSDGELMVRRR